MNNVKCIIRGGTCSKKIVVLHPPIKYSFNNYVHVIYISKKYGIFLPRYNFTLSEKMSKNWKSFIQNKKVTAHRHVSLLLTFWAHFSQNDSCNINVEVNNHLFSFFSCILS